MKGQMGEEYPAFLDSFDQPVRPALRVNTLKGSIPEAKERLDFLDAPVPWAESGFYYREEARPGKHPCHEAGAYYMQEASAMMPVHKLEPKPGERVLDLCGAPGGKSTQIAAAMQGEGLLISNEIHPARAGILSENMERMGVRNGLVVSHEPAALAERFPLFFDKILVDAPCSGEGMFRRRQETIGEWSIQNVELCAARQDKILESAAGMLRPGGRMVYSTCTFEALENEGTIERFLQMHPEFAVMDMGRLLPHRLEGEGHFWALLQKEGDSHRESAFAGSLQQDDCWQKPGAHREQGEWTEFWRENLRRELLGEYLRFGDQLYLTPWETPQLKGLKVLRPGLHLGTLKKNRFEPSHALALYLKPKEAVRRLEIPLEAGEKYMQGQTLEAEGEKGWYLVCVRGYSLGWGKLSGGILKNHYPKGLRRFG